MAEHTDTDFNKFRCRATGEIVEAWQWWSGKEWGERCRIESYGPGAWLVAPFARGQLSYNESDFRRVCEPIHPERKRLQKLADDLNSDLVGPWGQTFCERVIQKKLCRVDGVWYVKDREPPCQDFGASCLDDMLGTVVVEDDPPPAEETICVKCARQGYEVEFGLWTIGTFRCEMPTEPRMDYVLGGMREPELPLCREKNTDGRCPDFVPRSK